MTPIEENQAMQDYIRQYLLRQQLAAASPSQQSTQLTPQQGAAPPPAVQNTQDMLLTNARQVIPPGLAGGFSLNNAVVQSNPAGGFHGDGPQPLPGQQTISPMTAQLLTNAWLTRPGPAGGFHGSGVQGGPGSYGLYLPQTGFHG